MFENDPDYKPHPDDTYAGILEPHRGMLYRIAVTHLANHPPLTWEYGICPTLTGNASVIPCDAKRLKDFLGEELFNEATEYVDQKFKRLLAEKNVADPRQEPANV